MRQWPLQDAEVHFNSLLETCLQDGPQGVSDGGVPKAVIVSIEDWQALNARVPPTLKDLLLASEPKFDLDIPDRSAWKLRDIPDLE